MDSDEELITIVTGDDDKEYGMCGAPMSRPQAVGDRVFSLARISLR
jgi:hypothetical protein